MPYHNFMFTYTQCSAPGCTKAALTTFDGEKDFCFIHSKNQEKAQKSIQSYITANDKIMGLTADGLSFQDFDFSGKQFFGCSFRNCTFSNIKTSNCYCRLCVFDFSVFTDCSFLASDIKFSTFAGAAFSHVLFTGSNLIQNNFEGITSYQSSFDDSDLYNSRFICAHLINTSLRNCNIKKTLFFELETQNVSFKMSNTREAIFDKSGSALMNDENAVDDWMV